MNNQEAREILLLYRPGTSDANDAEFAEALAWLRQDPGLERWFNEHCAVQGLLRDKFRQISVPEGLKEQILSERQIHAVPLLKRKMAMACLFIFAMLLLAGAGILFLRPHEDKTFANFRARMVSMVARQYPKMDLETGDMKQIREALAQKGAPADYVLPAALEKVVSTGCAVLGWQGKPVSMVCFNSGRNGQAKEPDLFLFIISRNHASKGPATAKPQFGLRSRYATASWTYRDKTYLLAEEGTESMLRSYF